MFRVSKVGAIAGCYVQSGMIVRNALIRVRRSDEIVHKGAISSLKRFKDDVKEVQAGFECGIGIGDFNDFEPGDFLEVYIEEKHSKTLD